MPWIITTGRPSGRFEPIDDDDDDYLLNGFACVGEIPGVHDLLPDVRRAARRSPAAAARPRAFD